MIIERALATLDATRLLATDLAAQPELLMGQVIYLSGDLGMGKTTLARFLLQALGYQGRVKSPTYGLLEQYDLGDLQVLHLDLYRLLDAEELEYLGLRDLHDQQSLLLAEWPDKGKGALPLPDLQISLSGGVSHRIATLALKNNQSRLSELDLFANSKP